MTRIAASVNKYGGVRMEIKKTAGRRSDEKALPALYHKEVWQ